MSSRPTTADTSSGRPTAAAAAAGLRALRVALERLFAPQPVTLEPAATGAEAFTSLEATSEAHGLGAAFEVGGAMTARLVLLANPGEDTQLTAALLHRPWSADTVLDLDGQAAFAEMANIVASSFLNGAAGHLGLKLIPSVPLLGERPVRRIVRAMTADGECAMAARFAIDLPWGLASGTFFATLITGGS